MIIGAIDVGSNSVKLLVAEVKRRKVRPIEHRSHITRLGRGMDRTRTLSAAAQNRTIEVLREFRRVCEKIGADRVVAVATEAVRNARNRRRFLERCKKEAGIRPRIVSGREEGRLAFLGATFGRRERWLAAVDIGGGSTEFMVGSPGLLERSVSLPLGAVRLTESILKSDPPSPAERIALLEKVRDGLAGHFSIRLSATFLGVGGTCVNVARMARPDGDPEGRRLALGELEALFDRLAGVPLKERKEIPGIDPDRADIIVAGAAILVEAMKALAIGTFTATVHGLRRGLVLDAARRPPPRRSL